MATIIDRGDGSIIAGDPQPDLEADQHWCGYCTGTGLEYDEDGPQVCGACDGTGATKCVDDACGQHRNYSRVSCPCGYRDLNRDLETLIDLATAHRFSCPAVRS